MKKIINGKLYNTNTAKRVGFWMNDGSWRDFNHVEETLYQKKTGEFFLHGEGGPNTRYSERTGMNSWSGGDAIMPMTYKEAREWAEKKLDADDYETIFGAVPEDDSKMQLCISISTTAAETVKRLAAEKGTTVSALIEEMILR